MTGERGAKGGVVIDTSGTDESSEVDNATSLTQIETDNEPLTESSAEPDIDGGTEDQEAGRDANEVESETRPSGTEPRPQDDVRIANVERMIKEVSDKISAPPVKERTPEEWAAMEQEYGVPRGAIERFTRQNVTVYNKIKDEMDARFAKYEMNDALGDLVKEQGFNDAVRYKKDVTAYLSRYETKHWTNPQLLKDAVIYARGLNANANVQKARTDSQRNVVVAGKGRPASPGGGQRRSNPVPLTKEQKEAAEMMGSESEYRKFMSKGRMQIE